MEENNKEKEVDNVDNVDKEAKEEVKQSTENGILQFLIKDIGYGSF